MKRNSLWVASVLSILACRAEPAADLLLLGGSVLDGTGGEARQADIAVRGDRIAFVGAAAGSGVRARDTVRVDGLLVAPGFIDMHSHAELEEDWGKDAEPFLTQGITTVAIGVDGGGPVEVDSLFAGFERRGIGVNALTYVGHGTVRRRVMGMAARAPTAAELDSMRALVRQAMEAGAFGLSSGLFYTPGTYATTEEVIEVARVAAPYGGIYDTHDRDLGAAYPGIGYLASTAEGIRIGEESGTRVIFSHFNPQGARNYGRAPEGAKLVEEARARGVEVWAAQHPYTATQSNLRSYAVPDWAAAGGDSAMRRRFADPDTVRLLDRETTEMLAIRGGAEKLLFADPRPELNGRTLAQVAEAWRLPVPATVRRILSAGNAAVMNLDLYDIENTRFLAQQPWMMTCTDGRTPAPDQGVTHPRVFGAFTRKLKLFVLDQPVLTMPFAIRGMTGLAADFLRLPDRGDLREGMVADIVVLDPGAIEDRATYENPRLRSRGTVHVLVSGKLALEDGELTGTLAGRPIRRP
ncbi:MAG: amidohydrolase family protein [Gemmatimonadales bacterium]